MSLLSEEITPRKKLPPLLLKLSERRAEKLDYLGVSYGLTAPLLKYERAHCGRILMFSQKNRRTATPMKYTVLFRSFGRIICCRSARVFQQFKLHLVLLLKVLEEVWIRTGLSEADGRKY